MRQAVALLFALLVTLGVGAAGCRSNPDLGQFGPFPPAKEPDPQGRIEERSEVDPETGAPLHEWSVFITPGRGALKHGVERIWYKGGALQWEREFRYGKPNGPWRSWYENGNPCTECFYLGPDVERTMTFWREDGKLSAQGPACDAARRGQWRFWWANGQLAEEGEYRGGLKAGPWTAWSRDGKRRFERVYEKNVRVSQREVPVEVDPSPSPARASATEGPVADQ